MIDLDSLDHFDGKEIEAQIQSVLECKSTSRESQLNNVLVDEEQLIKTYGNCFDKVLNELWLLLTDSFNRFRKTGQYHKVIQLIIRKKEIEKENMNEKLKFNVNVVVKTNS